MPPEATARTLCGALAAAVSAKGGGVLARDVHRMPSKELVRVLGHRCMKRLRRR
ncbi:hypothetical protein [Streptomyces sp. NPDC090057]|uniref:hypothetical protein n=1 Tax=Streptomyces sp. NPDC090057 TaxID=3365935 RepID=UPI0037FF9C63